MTIARAVDVAALLKSHAQADVVPRRGAVLTSRDITGEALRSAPSAPESEERVRSALQALDPDCTYEQWRDILFSVQEACGDRGLPLVVEFSRRAPHRYVEGSAEKLFSSNRERPDGITRRTLFKLARDAGWRDDALSGVAAPAASQRLVTEPTDLDRYKVAWGVDDPPPASHDFVVGAGGGGMLPIGKPSVLAGPGGSMKTAAAIEIVLQVAAGQDWAGHRVAPGSALLLSCEDDAAECRRRVIAGALGFERHLHAQLQQRVQIVAMPGADTRLTLRVFGAPERTALVDRIVTQAQRHAARAGVPLRLIVVDHARLVIGGDVNDSEFATELMRALSFIGEQTGAAVLLLCHSPKSSLNPQRGDDYSAADVLGSGAFVDNARFAAVLSPLTQDERKRYTLDPDQARQHLALRVIKSNYSAAGRSIYLRRTVVEGWGVARPVPVDLGPFNRAPVRSGVGDRILAFVSERPGQLSLRKLRDAYAGKSGPLAASERDVRDAADALVVSGRLVLRAPTDVERREHALPHQTSEVLDVP